MDTGSNDIGKVEVDGEVPSEESEVKGDGRSLLV